MAGRKLGDGVTGRGLDGAGGNPALQLLLELLTLEGVQLAGGGVGLGPADNLFNLQSMLIDASSSQNEVEGKTTEKKTTKKTPCFLPTGKGQQGWSCVRHCPEW